MKKFTQFLIVFLVAITLTSCTKQEINKALYIIPAIFLGLAIYLLYKVWEGYNSGSVQQTKTGIVYGKEKVISWGRVAWAALLLLCTAGSAYWIYEENRNYDPKKDGVPKEAPKDNRESAEEQARKADSVYKLNK